MPLSERTAGVPGTWALGATSIPAALARVDQKNYYFRSLSTLAPTIAHESSRLIIDSSLTQHQAIPRTSRRSTYYSRLTKADFALRPSAFSGRSLALSPRQSQPG